MDSIGAQGGHGRPAGPALEDEAKHADEALRRSEERFRLLAENTADGIVMVDGDGRIVMVNEAAEGMFRYRRDELLGQPVEVLLPQALRQGHAAHRMNYAASGDARARPMSAGLTLTARRKDESEFPVEISLTPLRAEESTVVVAAISDISDRRRMEEQLKQTVEDLTRSNAELERFAYVASHDLQEPLRMISSYTQLLGRRYSGKLGDEADEFIAYAVDGARRMQRLINDLLAYSRLGADGRELGPVDSDELLERAVTDLGVLIEETGAGVTHDALPVVRADDTLLAKLFVNLIGNAIKFHGEEPPHVHVSARREGSRWVFCVRDNGIGIDRQYHERIFTVFQRLHSKEAYPGSGMGLAICKKIVEQQGGRIWVESSIGNGSAFFFTLEAENEQRIAA